MADPISMFSGIRNVVNQRGMDLSKLNENEVKILQACIIAAAIANAANTEG
jgi:hypothetical protein